MSTMTAEQVAAWREWNRNRWEAVESLKARGLAEMTEDRARQIIERLRLFAPAPPDPFNGEGLVQQQSFFHKCKV